MCANLRASKNEKFSDDTKSSSLSYCVPSGSDGGDEFNNCNCDNLIKISKIKCVYSEDPMRSCNKHFNENEIKRVALIFCVNAPVSRKRLWANTIQTLRQIKLYNITELIMRVP